MTDFSEWLAEARSDPKWEQLSPLHRQHLAMEAARGRGTYRYMHTVEEYEHGARLTEEDPEAADLYSRWITVRAPEPDLRAWDNYRVLLALAMAAKAKRPDAVVVCGACTDRHRKSLASVYSTPHGVLLERTRKLVEATNLAKRDDLARLGRPSGGRPSATGTDLALLGRPSPDPRQWSDVVVCPVHGGEHLEPLIHGTTLQSGRQVRLTIHDAR